MELLWGGSREGERMLSQHLFATCHADRSDWGQPWSYSLQVLLLPSPAASSHFLVLSLLRHHFPDHNQHQELGVSPVLQVLINEPSLGSVGLPSPWNRILLVHLLLHNTAAFSLLSICKLVQGPRSANKFAASSWRAWRFGRILGKYLPASPANLVNTFHD